jgi:hypothetical protein
MIIIENDLVTFLKARLSKFTYDIVDEDLTADAVSGYSGSGYSGGYIFQYNSLNKNWVIDPPERIRWMDIGNKEHLIMPAEYIISYTGGYITLSTPKLTGDIIRADYSFFPFTDAQLLSIVQSAYKQIETLIFKPIPIGASGYSGISGYSGASGYSGKYFYEEYREVILKRCYTIAVRMMQFPTIKYFTISIGGRSIGKENQVTMCNTLIDDNEKELMVEINALRYFDRSEPVVIK